MDRYNESQLPGVMGGTGQSRRNDGIATTDYIIADSPPVSTPKIIPIAAGGPIAWAVCDALYTLRDELIKRGLVADGEQLVEAIYAAWLQMRKASYLTSADLEAWEVSNEVVRYANWTP